MPKRKYNTWNFINPLVADGNKKVIYTSSEVKGRMKERWM